MNLDLQDRVTASQNDVARPIKLAHVVLRTSKFDEIVGWYKLVLDAHASF